MRRAGSAVAALLSLALLSGGCFHDVASDDTPAAVRVQVSVVNRFDWDGFHPQPLRVQVDRGRTVDLPFAAVRTLSVRPGAHTLHLWDDGKTFELRVPVDADAGALEVGIGPTGATSVRPM